VNAGTRSGGVRLDQAQAAEIGDRPLLIVERDRFGIVAREERRSGGDWALI
jgi:hypothetical protein